MHLSNAPPSSVPPPKQIGHYEVVAELGRGGMGVVYRARDLALGRDVALKSILPGHADPIGFARFVQEARASARLSHPNIVPVFEIVEDRGQPWLAMELVEGQTLREALRQHGRLPIEDVVRYGEALADALDAAHRSRLLHRDVSPNNIMLRADGRIQLMDFGLARHFEPFTDDSTSTSNETQSLFAAATFAGTPRYMAPEQVLGKDVDQRADLFSLGAVLYEMCTGRPAFSGASRPALTDAILHRIPDPVAQLNRDAPQELERIVHKALAKRADERYQTASDLTADLRALRRQLESADIGVTRNAAWQQVRAILRSRSAIAMGTAIALTGIAALLWFPRNEEPVLLGTPRQLTTAPGWEAEPALSPDGGFVAYVSGESGNPDIWIVDVNGGNPLKLTDDEASDSSPAWFPDGSALVFVSTRGGRPGIWKVPRLGGAATLLLAEATDPAVSPDGNSLAFSRTDPRGFKRIGVATLREPMRIRTLTGDDDGLWTHVSPAWSPDGRLICYAAQRDLWIVPADGGKPVRLTTDEEVHWEPVWSADGRYIYFASYREGTEAVWRIRAEGGLPTRVTQGTGPERHPTISKDGARIAYSTVLSNHDVVLVDLRTGTEHRLTGQRQDAHPTLSPNAGSVVFISDRWSGRFEVWSQALNGVEPHGPARRLTDHPGGANHPAVSPDGRWVAYARVVGSDRDIWTVPASGGAPVRVTDDRAVDIHPAWSPDGSRLAFVSNRSGTYQVWSLPVSDGKPDGPALQLSSHPTPCQAPVWSVDGRIAYIADGDVWVAQARAGAPAHRVTSNANAHRARWRPESERLFVSAFFGTDLLRLVEIDIRTGLKPTAGFETVMGRNVALVDFDVLPGGLLVFSREELRGDIWVLDRRSRSS